MHPHLPYIGAEAHIPNQLARRMGRRPSREEVVGSHILKTPSAADLEKLERRAVASSLDKAIGLRPCAEALLERGILRSAEM